MAIPGPLEVNQTFRETHPLVGDDFFFFFEFFGNRVLGRRELLSLRTWRLIWATGFPVKVLLRTLEGVGDRAGGLRGWCFVAFWPLSEARWELHSLGRHAEIGVHLGSNGWQDFTSTN